MGVCISRNNNNNNNGQQKKQPKNRFSEQANFKVLMTGASNVGVTSLFRRVLEHSYHGDYFPSSKVSIGLKVFEGEHLRYGMELWDIPSAPAVKEFMQHSYLEAADGVIIVVDSTDLQSYNDIDTWLETFREHVPYELPIVLFANKCDSEQSILKEEDVAFSVNKYHLNGGFLVSAQKAWGLDEAFEFLLSQLVQAQSKRKEGQREDDEEELRSSSNNKKKKKKKKVNVTATIEEEEEEEEEKKKKQDQDDANDIKSPALLHHNVRNREMQLSPPPPQEEKVIDDIEIVEDVKKSKKKSKKSKKSKKKSKKKEKEDEAVL